MRALSTFLATHPYLTTAAAILFVGMIEKVPA